MLKDLIDTFEIKNLKKEYQKYAKAFDKFIFAIYKNRVRVGPHSPGKNKIYLKLDLNYEQLNGELLGEVKRIIAKLINKKSGKNAIKCKRLELKSIEEGCIELEFLVSALVCERILQLSDRDRLQLFRESITCSDLTRFVWHTFMVLLVYGY